MPDYATYRMLVTVLTPLHIGSGRKLLNEYDYAIHNKQTWRINEAALLESQAVEDPAIAEALSQRPWKELLDETDYDPGSHFFRYVIKGMPRSQSSGAQLQEQLKDPFDRPYLPGSSLKGALRTALGWYAWDKLGLQPDINRLDRRAKFAGQSYEREIFASAAPRPGLTPNYDLLKTMQISDSQPVDPSALILINASVINRSGETGKNIPVEVEALRPNTTFEMALKFDLALFSDWARRSGYKLPGEEWLKLLPAVCRAHANARIKQEIDWFKDIPKAKRLLSAYQQIAAADIGNDQFLIQLGWGTGWDGMTYGARLKQDPKFLQSIINQYNLARGARNPNDLFPKSRRAAMIFETSPDGQRSNLPAVPLGWILVTLQPLHVAEGWLDLDQPVIKAVTPPITQAATENASATSPRPQPSPASPVEPSSPAGRQPIPPAAPKKPVIKQFSTLPQPGDIFPGEVFDVTGTQVLLLIPGLADTQAFALIATTDLTRRVRDGESILCEVISLEQDKQRTWHVRCKMLR